MKFTIVIMSVLLSSCTGVLAVRYGLMDRTPVSVNISDAKSNLIPRLQAIKELTSISSNYYNRQFGMARCYFSETGVTSGVPKNNDFGTLNQGYNSYENLYIFPFHQKIHEGGGINYGRGPRPDRLTVAILTPEFYRSGRGPLP